MAVTLKDIAKRANVSVSTVSRIINNDMEKPASRETAERVWKIIHEMQYIPNQTARKLIHIAKDGSESLPKKSIACILLHCDDLYTDPFFSEVIAGIQSETAAQGYVMEYTIPISGKKSGTMDAAFFNNIVSRKVDGAILLGRMEQSMLDMLQTHIPHLVYCGLNYIPRDIAQVICDANEGFFAMVEYLIGLGHRQIGFLGAVNDDGALLNEWRCAAYRRGLETHGIRPNEGLIHEVDLSLEGGYNGMKRILEAGELATAYCCANDVTAIGAMRATLDSGLRVPEDISFIGFDDIEISRYVTPRLTTMHTYKKEMGMQAVNTLIDYIAGKNTLPMRVNMPYTLTARESCCILGEHAKTEPFPWGKSSVTL